MNRNKSIVVVPPVYDSLFDVHRRGSDWPELVLNNLGIQTELQTRNHLSSCIKAVCDKLPRADVEVTAAIESGLVTPAQAEEMYVRLAEFLKVGGHNARLVIYLPFELVPNASWKADSKSLDQAILKFHIEYLTAWQNLLSCHDVRACFVDGDILEPGLRKGPLPEVVKAAHLAWVLVSKGLITSQRVLELIKTSRDDVLRQSLCDSIRVMYDLGLIRDLNEAFNLSDPLLRRVAIELKGQSEVPEEETQFNLPRGLNPFKGLSSQIREEMVGLGQKLISLRGQVSVGRVKWLRQKGTQDIAKKFGVRISSALVRDLISVSDLKEFFQECIKDEFLMRVVVEAIGKFLEITAVKDLTSAHVFYRVLKPELDVATNSGSQSISAALEGVFSRLSFLGVIDREETVRPCEEFLLERTLSQIELDRIANLVEGVRVDEHLSKMLYPILLVYGSRAKGYAPREADFDLAIMVRPEVSLNERGVIQKKLGELAEGLGIEASFLEFWLEREFGQLGIRDFKSPDMHLGGNDLAHVLFEGAWVGHPLEIRQMFGELVSRFLLPDAEGIVGAVKGLLVREMERNTLQFRLMHKGYTYMYPPQGGIATKNSSAIDSGSSFWDSGYRWLATKLFVTKVFLPQAKSKKEASSEK